MAFKEGDGTRLALQCHMLKKTGKSRSAKKVWLLLTLLLIEAVAGYSLWRSQTPTNRFGYVIKNGDLYIVLWRTTQDEIRTSEYTTLTEALKFARKNLRLNVAGGPNSKVLEHLWVRNDVGRSILYWKTLDEGYVNRLTFKKESEALLFRQAFLEGAYSTSPIGHSISLMPLPSLVR
jgi:hypothetical protein